MLSIMSNAAEVVGYTGFYLVSYSTPWRNTSSEEVEKDTPDFK